MEKLNKTQISQALDTMSQWFPEESENINKYKEQIVDHIENGTNPSENSPLLSVKYAPSVKDDSSDMPELTKCETAIALFVADAVMFAFGLVGLHTSNQKRIARAIVREMGGDTLRGLQRAIHEFAVADGATNKAKALFSILGGIWNAGGFRAAIKVIQDEMSWWEWVKTGVIAVAQFTAWFATDGIAFIAEASICIMSAEQLIEDAINTGEACST